MSSGWGALKNCSLKAANPTGLTQRHPQASPLHPNPAALFGLLRVPKMITKGFVENKRKRAENAQACSHLVLTQVL